MEDAYDVVVIGAGPSGSIAARATAQAGLSTLLIEKRQEIGSPVRCAEAVGRETLAEFVALDPRWISAEIDSFSVSNPQGDRVVLPRVEKTLVLERKIFDRELARLAAEAGAEVAVKARATGLTRRGRAVDGVTMVVRGEPEEVRARIVIGADGTESQSPRWAGLDSTPPLRDYYVAAQYLMAGLDVNPRICQYHVGWSLAPGGYCWVFPKGDGQANVGLVIAGSGAGKTAIEYLNDFVAARFAGRPILSQIVGGIPVTNVLPEMVTDGYLAVGDAAHQSDPLHGGGITSGMRGGLLAAEVAVEAINQGDVSREFLRKYEQRWDAEFGRRYRRLYRIRQALLKVPEQDLTRMVQQASRLDAGRISLRDLLAIVLRSHPQLLLDVAPYFLGR